MQQGKVTVTSGPAKFSASKAHQEVQSMRPSQKEFAKAREDILTNIRADLVTSIQRGDPQKFFREHTRQRQSELMGSLYGRETDYRAARRKGGDISGMRELIISDKAQLTELGRIYQELRTQTKLDVARDRKQATKEIKDFRRDVASGKLEGYATEDLIRKSLLSSELGGRRAGGFGVGMRRDAFGVVAGVGAAGYGMAQALGGAMTTMGQSRTGYDMIPGLMGAKGGALGAATGAGIGMALSVGGAIAGSLIPGVGTVAGGLLPSALGFGSAALGRMGYAIGESSGRLGGTMLSRHLEASFALQEARGNLYGRTGVLGSYPDTFMGEGTTLKPSRRFNKFSEVEQWGGSKVFHTKPQGGRKGGTPENRFGVSYHVTPLKGGDYRVTTNSYRVPTSGPGAGERIYDLPTSEHSQKTMSAKELESAYGKSEAKTEQLFTRVRGGTIAPDLSQALGMSDIEVYGLAARTGAKTGVAWGFGGLKDKENLGREEAQQIHGDNISWIPNKNRAGGGSWRLNTGLPLQVAHGAEKMFGAAIADRMLINTRMVRDGRRYGNFARGLSAAKYLDNRGYGGWGNRGMVASNLTSFYETVSSRLADVPQDLYSQLATPMAQLSSGDSGIMDPSNPMSGRFYSSLYQNMNRNRSGVGAMFKYAAISQYVPSMKNKSQWEIDLWLEEGKNIATTAKSYQMLTEGMLGSGTQVQMSALRELLGTTTTQTDKIHRRLKTESITDLDKGLARTPGGGIDKVAQDIYALYSGQSRLGSGAGDAVAAARGSVTEVHRAQAFLTNEAIKGVVPGTRALAAFGAEIVRAHGTFKEFSDLIEAIVKSAGGLSPQQYDNASEIDATTLQAQQIYPTVSAPLEAQQ